MRNKMRKTPLAKIIQTHIAQHGPLDIGQFMNIALCHPEHGYYMKQDPFGTDGDFTTAPEISQIFGEVIGAWVADIWMQLGKPAPFGLVECGPGRGTLMSDILRATKGVPGFHEGCLIHLIEISPALKSIQAKTLEDYGPHWHQSLAAISDNYPLIFIGNEFFDALPFRQLIKQNGEWAERVVTQELSFGARPTGPELLSQIPPKLRVAEEGAIIELSPARQITCANICALLKEARGAGLFIDYGYKNNALGDSFQALYKHESVDVLDLLGDADLTSHVNFGALKSEAEKAGMRTAPITTQADFLNAIGLTQRAQYLLQKATPKQATLIKSAVERLTSADYMGTLFKVLGISYGKGLKLAGFDNV